MWGDTQTHAHTDTLQHTHHLCCCIVCILLYFTFVWLSLSISVWVFCCCFVYFLWTPGRVTAASAKANEDLNKQTNYCHAHGCNLDTVWLSITDNILVCLFSCDTYPCPLRVSWEGGVRKCFRDKARPVNELQPEGGKAVVGSWHTVATQHNGWISGRVGEEREAPSASGHCWGDWCKPWQSPELHWSQDFNSDCWQEPWQNTYTCTHTLTETHTVRNLLCAALHTTAGVLRAGLSVWSRQEDLTMGSVMCKWLDYLL